jgi:hypothetical protein
MDEKFEKSWKFYTLIIDWIKFSDTKAAAILAINGVIFGLVFRNIFEIMQNFPEKNLYISLSIIFGIITGILSIFCSVYCLFPNTNHTKPSIFFFEHIASYNDVKEYNKDFHKTISGPWLNLQVSELIWEISKIASTKYKRVKWAMMFLGLTIILLMIPLIILFGKFI